MSQLPLCHSKCLSYFSSFVFNRCASHSFTIWVVPSVLDPILSILLWLRSCQVNLYVQFFCLTNFLPLAQQHIKVSFRYRNSPYHVCISYLLLNSLHHPCWVPPGVSAVPSLVAGWPASFTPTLFLVGALIWRFPNLYPTLMFLHSSDLNVQLYGVSKCRMCWHMDSVYPEINFSPKILTSFLQTCFRSSNLLLSVSPGTN